MPDAISAAASIQLGFLQSPEIARETVPIAAQAQIANAQAGVAASTFSQEVLETVQESPRLGSARVPDSLAGNPNNGRPSYREPRRRVREPVRARAVPLAAAHPRGLGDMVDIRA